MPALIQLVGASPGGGLLDEGGDPAVVVDGHDAVAGGVVDRGEGDGALGAAVAVEVDQSSATSRSVSTSPLTTMKVSSMPAVGGGEADGTGGVERLGLDGVVQARRRRTGRRGRRR